MAHQLKLRMKAGEIKGKEQDIQKLREEVGKLKEEMIILAAEKKNKEEDLCTVQQKLGW